MDVSDGSYWCCPSDWWLVWHSGSGVDHINELKLRRIWLVLGLVTTFGGDTIPVFPGHSAWPSLRVSVKRVLPLVLATTCEEMASSALQSALLPGLLA